MRLGLMPCGLVWLAVRRLRRVRPGHGEQEPGLLADGLAAGASLALLDLPASRYPVHRVQLA
jgi:hypothetical protein